MVVVSSKSKTSSNTANGPGSEDDSVHGSNVDGSEEIGEKGGDGSEASSVASSEDPDGSTMIKVRNEA